MAIRNLTRFNQAGSTEVRMHRKEKWDRVDGARNILEARPIETPRIGRSATRRNSSRPSQLHAVAFRNSKRYPFIGAPGTVDLGRAPISVYLQLAWTLVASTRLLPNDESSTTG